MLSFSEKHNKLIVLFSKLDQDKSVNAAAIGQQLDELISGKLEFRLIVQSYEKVQAVIRDNIELKTLMISSREIKKFEGDNQEDQQNKSDKAELNTKMSLVQLLLYTQKDFEENRRERVQKVFGSEILSSENIGLDKSKVDEFYCKNLDFKNSEIIYS